MIIIGLIIIFLAGLTQGLTGFGFALVSVPVMMVFFPPKLVIPIIIVHAILVSMIVLFEARKWLDLKRIWPLMLAGIVGMPFGTYLLLVLDVNIIKMIVGVIVVLFALALLKGWKKEVKNEKLAFAPIGFISGLLQGSTSMSGPPVILFFSNQGASKQVFRANLIAYFLVLGLATIPVYFVSGLMTSEVIRYIVMLLPAMIVGTAVGIKLSHKVEEEVFRKIVLIIVTIIGLVAIISSLGIR